MSFAYAAQIEGVPDVFTQAVESGFSGYTQRRGLLSVDAGVSRLNITERRTVGEGIKLRLRDTAGELRALVRSRAVAETSLTGFAAGGIVTPGSNVDVTTTAGFDGVFYVGRSTFTYATSTATQFQNVQVAAYGSENAKIYQGQAVRSSPAAWTGRKLTLYLGGAALGTYRMSQPPQYLGGELWEVDATAIEAWYIQRQILDGVVQVQPPEERGIGSPTEFGTVEAVDAAGAKNTDLLLLFRLESGASQLVNVVSGGTSTEIAHTDAGLLAPSYRVYEERIGIGQGPDLSLWTSAQIAVRVIGDAASEAQKLLNSFYPSKSAGFLDDAEWQISAGLSIDLSALVGRAQWNQVLTEPMTVGELLYEVCLATGSYWYADATGNIIVAPLRDAVPPSAVVATIDDDVILVTSDDGANLSEGEIFGRVSLLCDWDPLSQQHLTRINYNDAAVRFEHPETFRSLELTSKFLRSDVTGWGGIGPQGQHLVAAANMSRSAIEGLLRRIQQYSATPHLDLSTKVPITYAGVRPGEVVSFTNARTPAFDGGTVGGQFLVLERAVDYDEGTVDLKLRSVEVGKLFAVALKVGGVVAGVIITAAAADYWSGADSLALGWQLTSPRLGVTRTIVSLSGSSTVVISSTMPGLVAGDVLVVTGSATNANSSGYTLGDYAVQDSGDEWS